jgi:hypothetical protein
MLMLLVTSLLRWWYTEGLRQKIQSFANRLEGTMDFFSFSLLIKTLFSPFRQISAGRVDGPLGVQLRALVDKLVSRIIGAGIRITILVVGGVIVTLQLVLIIFLLIGWLAFPIIPVIGIILSVLGINP